MGPGQIRSLLQQKFGESMSEGMLPKNKEESAAVICQAKNENKNFPWLRVIF